MHAIGPHAHQTPHACNPPTQPRAPTADPNRKGAAPTASGVPQALTSGPVTLADADPRRLLNSIDSVAMKSGKDLIQATFTAGGDANCGLSSMTEKVGAVGGSWQ
jgi:hypothetical protein